MAAKKPALERDTAPPPTFEAQVIESAALWWFSQALSQAGAGDLETALQPAQDRADRFVDCLLAAGVVGLDAASSCARQVDAEHPLAHLTP